MILHLVDIGVPHLGEEPEGRWGIWIVYRELDPSLERNTGHVLHLHEAQDCIHNILHDIFLLTGLIATHCIWCGHTSSAVNHVSRVD